MYVSSKVKERFNVFGKTKSRKGSLFFIDVCNTEERSRCYTKKNEINSHPMYVSSKVKERFNVFGKTKSRKDSMFFENRRNAADIHHTNVQLNMCGSDIPHTNVQLNMLPVECSRSICVSWQMKLFLSQPPKMTSLPHTMSPAAPCVAVCCSVLQCVAVCRSVLQRVSVCCSVIVSVPPFKDD